jgi:hypothetical protein
MRRSIKPCESDNPADQLAWLVLRVIAALSPCTKTSLIAYIAAGDSRSELAHTMCTPHRRELIGNALLKLEGLAFVQFVQAQIAITDEGRRFLDELTVVALELDARSAKTSKSWSDLFEQPWTRYIALLREFTTTLLPNYIPRLNRFCQEWLAGTGAAVPQGFLMNGVRARDIALEVWKGKVAPIVRFRAKTAVHVMTRLAICRTFADAAAIATPRSGGGMLWKSGTAPSLSTSAKLAGLSRLVVGAVLLVALSTAGGVALLSGKRAESTREASIMTSQGAPIVWFYDGQDHPKQSIFVTRNFSGAAWIEGISIRGENTSNRSLIAVQATLISDTGEAIDLTISAVGSQQTQGDAHEVPSGSEFTLEYGFPPDTSGQQSGMPAKEFLSKYGGMIFKFRYTMPGVQRTLIEYFSPSSLKAQLVDAERSAQGI